MKKFVNSCIIRDNKNKKSDKSPDAFGFIEIDKELLSKLVAQWKAHGKSCLNVNMYHNTSDDGQYTVLYLREGDPTWKPTKTGAAEAAATEDDDLPPF